ncbi:MAG: baseplate J/gp47 family protein [Rickettsiales bacterium]|nr:baseplate J/gp47 family protein [Rickettsiales bacterium]
MPINYKTIQELQQSIASAFILSINKNAPFEKQIDPNLPNSLIKGLVDSTAAGFDELQDIIKETFKQLFPQTATGEYLQFWGQMFGINRKSSTKATGFIIFTGNAGSIVDTDTSIQDSNGVEFLTTSQTTIATNSIAITITRNNNIATATTLSEHNFATGMSIVIAGANQTDYNKTAIITVINDFQFTYQVDNSPISPATGSITATANFGIASIIATSQGYNALSGTNLELVSPIENIDDECFIQTIIYGNDTEDDETLRARIIERTSNFTAPFTEAGLPTFIKEKVNDITRIWVKTATPTPGYTTIYFVKDKQANIIPSGQELLEVKNSIINSQTGIKPANMTDNMVVVSAPTPKIINFTFTSISPNTSEMKQLIKDNITDYFKSKAVDLGKDILANEYISLIYSTLDNSGNRPQFALSSPSGDINVADNELPILGNINI